MTQTTTEQRPAKPKREVRIATVLRREQLSRSMVRVVLGGPGLDGFPGIEHSDAYVKLVLLHPAADYPSPLDLDAVRETHPPEHWPRLRTYTVRQWDGAAGQLTIDVVVHGDRGVAGPWAAAVRPGEQIHLLGPGGGYVPDPSADWHLLIGDESALPAIAAALEHLSAGARGQAFIEVSGADDEQAMTHPDGVALTWVHRGTADIGTKLFAAVRQSNLPPGRMHGFVHGEAGLVKQFRRWLRIERGVAAQDLSISGYWRIGVNDEGWRAAKRDWLAEAEAAERAAGVA